MRIARDHRAYLLAALAVAAFAPGRVVAAGQGAPPPAPPGKPAGEATNGNAESDSLPLPPGTPADQALWRQAGEVSLQITTVRTASNGLQWRIRTLDLVARLHGAAKAASPDEARRLEALRERLETAQVENYLILTSQWPVDPTRGCQYPQLMLGSAMNVADGPDKRILMGQAREDAQRCVDAASLAVGQLSRSNDTLAPAVDAAVKAVPWGPPPGPSSGTTKD